jgi:serine/threonine protein kinase
VEALAASQGFPIGTLIAAARRPAAIHYHPMPLEPGSNLGPYEIIAPLGAGGMGEVYRARDPRLNRDVAIKFLPPRGDKARFQTEARALAALNHPNIVAIYDVGENYLVTELVDGAPMKANGLRQAIDFAAQTAEGLAAAHGIGIYHRDIKPANLLVTREGRVKIIDFGLAKDSEHSDGAETLTAEGAVMGTAAYMSPEQIRAQKADGRTDVFSLAVVLYEQVAGHRPFRGETVAQVMAAILEKEPEDLPDTVPQHVKQILARCLAKDRAARFQSAGDLAFALRAIGPATTLSHTQPRPSRIWQGVAAVLALMLAAALWGPWRTKETPQLFRLTIDPSTQLGASNNSGIAISPDGTRIAFVGVEKSQIVLYVRRLDSLDASLIPGTEGATRPFWSPDGKNIGYFTLSNLMRVALDGSTPQLICRTGGSGRGGAWNRDGVIVFATGGTVGSVLYRVSASGGDAVPITFFDDARRENAHYYPQFLPDGKRFLYYRRSIDGDKSAVYAGSLDDPDKGRKDKLVVHSPFRAIYAPAGGGSGGHLVFLRGNNLFVQPFDPDSAAASGDPVVAASNVYAFAGNSFADISASDNGILAYSAGGIDLNTLYWRDRAGNTLSQITEISSAIFTSVSADNRMMTSQRIDQSGSGLWVTDLERKTSRKLMVASTTAPSVISPDGSRVAYALNADIFTARTDGLGRPELLLRTTNVPSLTHWSRDNRFLIYSFGDQAGRGDIWAAPMAGGGKPFPVVNTPAAEYGGALSPDSKWIAYVSEESGSPDVYIQGFPEAKGRWLVSTGGGTIPRWSDAGDEIFFRDLKNSIHAARIERSGEGLNPGKPVPLFTSPSITFHTDGKRFLTPETSQSQTRRPIVVMLNWQQHLR